ncbi:hypothetical protein PENTCL1PPCAC_3391, partial [Pristionchus entomophagus]
FLLIFCQYVIPLLPHLYFVFGYVNWINDTYTGWDNTTGSIYRAITGVYYLLFAISGVTLNTLAVHQLRKLSHSSAFYYKQQKSLVIYTLTSTSIHLFLSFSQFVWSYAFLSGNTTLLISVRGAAFNVYDVTSFADPIVLICISKHVRAAL